MSDEHEHGTRIVSDGTPQGTRVLLDGRLVPDVIDVAWSASMEGSSAIVHMRGMPVDLTAEEVVFLSGEVVTDALYGYAQRLRTHVAALRKLLVSAGVPPNAIPGEPDPPVEMPQGFPPVDLDG